MEGGIRTPKNEYIRVFYVPNVVKRSRFSTTLEKYPALIIFEDANAARAHKLWLAFERACVCVRRYRERFVEVRVLRKSEGPPNVRMHEVPKDFWFVHAEKRLWRRDPSEIRARRFSMSHNSR